MSIRVVVADNDSFYSECLNILTRDREGIDEIEIISVAGNGKTDLDHINELQPDVMIAAVNASDPNWAQMISRISDRLPNVKIIALSMVTDTQFLLKALKAGASGYLLKSCTFGEMARAVTTVMNDDKHISAELTGSLIEAFLVKSYK